MKIFQTLLVLLLSTSCSAFLSAKKPLRRIHNHNAVKSRSLREEFKSSIHNRSSPSVRFITCLQQSNSPSDDSSSKPTSSGAFQDADNTFQDADSTRRRQLLFSLLATSSVVPTFGFARTAAAAAKKGAKEANSPTINVLRPPLDDREYEAFVLDNGIRVLLCSDQSSNEAACAMDVHVGACSDPEQVPGLAHFNEHMLFLGTEAFPQEDSFSSFLSTNGGSSNAFTDSENTVYYFDMEAEEESRFAEGLIRFGSFFTSPLFTQSATGRELNAIESENSKNLQNDIFRIYQIEKSRANLNHPYSKFFTGNKKTLLDDTKSQGIDLRQQLIEFYNRYYSANQMTLAVVGPQPMEELKKTVFEAFSGVPNRNIPKPEEAWAGVPPFNDNSVIPSFGHVVEVVPVQDLRQVSLTWPIVYTSEEDRQDAILNKPEEYVSHLIGHEGPGSLLSYLKREGWANALGSSTNADLTDFETFEVTVELTNKGLAAVDSVTEAIFSYISMLRDRSIPNYVFEEVLQLDELEWRFLTKGNPGGYVQSLVTAMQKYPPSLYVAGPRRLALLESNSKLLATSAPRSSFSSNGQRELAKKSSCDLISKLTVDNSMINVLSKSFEKQADQVEKWYGTKYRVRPIPQATLAKWKNCVNPEELGLAFPRRNVFIPTEKGLRVKKRPAKIDKSKKRTFESRMQPLVPPKVIRDDGDEGRWTVYYKQDDRFGQPKAYIVFQLLTNEVYASAKSVALAQLYRTCASDILEEYAYDARLAGLTYDVQVLPRGVRLTFGGYNDKLKDFVLYVTKKLARDVDTIVPKDNAEFDRYKDNIMRALSAFDVKQPYSHAIYYSALALQPPRFQYTNAEQRDAIQKTTRDELISYVKELWSSGKGEALVQGNVDENEAQDLVNAIDDTIFFRTISASEYPPRLKVLKLPPTGAEAVPNRLTISEPNPSNGNSASQVVIQSLGESEKDHVMIELISAILEEPFYEDLRTKQQLGYIVSSGLKAPDSLTRTLSLIVQSSVAPVEKLTTEILKFLDGFKQKILEPIPKGDLAVYVKGLIDRKTEPDKTLAVEVTRNWSEVANGRLQFDRVQREAAALLDVSKADLLEFWDTIYAGDGRRVLISEIVPRTGPASSNAPPKSTGYSQGKVAKGKSKDGLKLGIDDIASFRANREKEQTDAKVSP